MKNAPFFPCSCLLIIILLLAYKETFVKRKSCLKNHFRLFSKIMKYKRLIGFLIAQILFVSAIFAQQTVVINEPNTAISPVVMNNADEALIKREVLPKARKYWAKNEACDEDFQIVGQARGSFTAP